MKTILTTCVTALALLAPASLVGAGRKPDPEPVIPEAADEPDIEAFKAAYQRAGEPRILVICGSDRRSGTVDARTQERTATGRPSAARHVGRDLLLFTPAGDAAKLKADIEEVLLKNRDVELVDVDSLSERDRREVELLRLRSEGEAIRLLGTKVNADLVLLIRMQWIAGALSRQRHRGHRVTVSILEAARGRKIGGFAFDWQAGKSDSVTIKKYARAIARKFIEQFCAWYAAAPGGTARRYTLRVLGLSDVGQLVKARDTFGKIPGVSKVKDRGFTGGTRTSVATLDLSYAGRSLDLLYHLQQAAAEKLGMKVQGIDGAAGTLTLLAAPADRKDARWRILADPEHPRHPEVRALLTKLYKAQGSPKIGIVITRALSDAEKKDPRYARRIEKLQPPAGGDKVSVSLVLAGRDANIVGGIPARLDEDVQAVINRLLNVRLLEDALYKRMLRLGLTMVDPKHVYAKMTPRDRLEVFNEHELPYLFGKSADLDIVIHGVGRVERGGAGRYWVTYAFRAVRVADGVTLAAQGWSSRKGYVTAPLPYRDVIQRLSAYAAGNLCDQEMDFWAPANRLTVSVSNAKTQKDVLTVMAFFEQNVPGVLSADFREHHVDEKGQGAGTFVIASDLTYGKLAKQIKAKEKDLPFDLKVSGTSRDALSVRIKDGM